MASSLSEGSLLPFELLESILVRVPAQSLIRFQLVCKRWLELLKEKRFIHNNFDQVYEHHFIKINTNMVEIINPITKARWSCLPFPDEFRARINIVKPYHVIHCDGLLLCTFRSNYVNQYNEPILESGLAVWNPCLNQVRWISDPLRYSYEIYDYYGFGYDNVYRDNYKILRIGNEMLYDNNDVKTVFEIYEFKSNSWRTLDVPYWKTYFMCVSGVSIKGNMYWVARTINDHLYFSIYIQCFDFSTEKFKYMCDIPFFLIKGERHISYDAIALSIFRNDKLLLVRQCVTKDDLPSGEIEVWITNSVKDKVLKLTKLFVLSRPGLPKLIDEDYEICLLYFMDKNNKLNVICREEELTDEVASLYISGKDGFRKEAERDILKCYHLYFPSLVPVP